MLPNLCQTAAQILAQCCAKCGTQCCVKPISVELDLQINYEKVLHYKKNDYICTQNS